MNRKTLALVVILLGMHCAVTSADPITWRQCLGQPPEFYKSAEGIRVADNVLLYQRNDGGWPKNIDMAAVLNERAKAKVRQDKNKNDSTFDNNGTHTQMRYLAKVRHATRLERFDRGFYKGLDYILRAQHDAGGWPQYYPKLTGYYKHITFNDGATIGVMTLLRDIADKKPPYDFVDEDYRQKAEKAVEKGIECILKCQIVVNGKKTAWCAQHDSKTYAPAKARSYELPSISGSESVGIVRFLMAIDNPSPEIIEAIQCAVAWFDEAKLEGIRQIRKEDKSTPKGWDKVVIKDPSAPPMWARFYEIGTNTPIFCSRDGIPKKTLAEISYERRTGYSWLGHYASGLLANSYPAWQKKWAPGENVLDH